MSPERTKRKARGRPKWSVRLSCSAQIHKMNGRPSVWPLCHRDGGTKERGGGQEADKPTHLQREERRIHRRERADLFVSFLFPRLDWKRLHFALKLVHLHVQRVYCVLKTDEKGLVNCQLLFSSLKNLTLEITVGKNNWTKALNYFNSTL